MGQRSPKFPSHPAVTAGTQRRLYGSGTCFAADFLVLRLRGTNSLGVRAPLQTRHTFRNTSVIPRVGKAADCVSSAAVARNSAPRNRKVSMSRNSRHGV